MTATEALTAALLEMADRGQKPRCRSSRFSAFWTSDSADERVLAASWCAGCPLTAHCQAAADEQGEKFGVWAGVDRGLTKAAVSPADGQHAPEDPETPAVAPGPSGAPQDGRSDEAGQSCR